MSYAINELKAYYEVQEYYHSEEYVIVKKALKWVEETGRGDGGQRTGERVREYPRSSRDEKDRRLQRSQESQRDVPGHRSGLLSEPTRAQLG